jgi:hypothetical protein
MVGAIAARFEGPSLAKIAANLTILQKSGSGHAGAPL